MITVARIEQAVARRIKTALPTALVQAYPADIRTFLDSFRAASGAILVQYTGRERTALARTRGTQIVSIEISAISKNLREHTGIYPLLDGAFVALSGVPLTEIVNTEEREMGVVFLQKGESYETYLEKNGLWVFTQMYESEPFPYVQIEEETHQLITQISLKLGATIETTIPEP